MRTLGGGRIAAIRDRLFVMLVLLVLAAPPVAAVGPTAAPTEPVPRAPSEDAPVETSFEEGDPEVQFYANRHDVPVARAVEIANWLEDAAPLLTALPLLVETYADARLVHGGSAEAPDLPVGEVRVEIKAKDPFDTELRSLIASIEGVRVGGFGAAVTVDGVPRTLAELDALAAQEMAGVDPDSAEIVYDFDEGTVSLQPVPPPDPDFSWLSQCANVSGGSLDGGRHVRLDDSGISGCQEEVGCTSGFPMKFAYTFGVTTAGHCVDGLGMNYPADSNGWVTNPSDRDTDMYFVFPTTVVNVSAYAYWYDGPALGGFDDDVAFLRRVDASSSYSGRIWKWDTGEWRNIVGHEATYALVGMTVCAAASTASQNGASTYCGMVIDSNTGIFGFDSGFQRWTEVDFTQGDYHQGRSGGHGSSGGTIFYGGFVYGLMSSADNCPLTGTPLCTPGRYYQVRYLQDAMEAVSTNVQFICFNTQFCVPS